MRFALLIALGLSLMSAAAPSRAADGLFAPRIIIDDNAITNYEVEQRVAFLKAVNTVGDLEAMALRDLIEDRLKLRAGELLELELTDEQVQEGMAEFAGRANLSVEEFSRVIGEAGVAPETFRDFVRAGLMWRDVIREKFVGIVIVSEGEIDRAFSVTSRRSGLRVLLSELVLPAAEGEFDDAVAQAEELAATIGSVDEFSEAAAQFSAAGSREQGGQIDWIDIGNLPPGLRDVVVTLQPGQITPPIILPNAVALFQLRGIEETNALANQTVRLDYMQLLLPNTEAGLAQAAQIKTRADRCDDLFALMKGAPESQLQRLSQSPGEVPRDVGIELAKLDAGEMTFGLQRDGNILFLMLCSRDVVPEVAEGAEPPTREQIRDRILNQKLNLAADGYLRQLRAAAVIREP